MRADLEGALEGIKEKVAQQEARRLATLEHKEQARLEREKGGGGGPAARPGSPQLTSM
jgi:hypothetical protein